MTLMTPNVWCFLLILNNSDTTPELGQTPQVRALSHKTATTSDADHKIVYPGNPHFCLTWLQTRGSHALVLRFNNLLEWFILKVLEWIKINSQMKRYIG